jgi:soluble lytic murein transglycosylase-like protein/Zn-dependent protease with chaperone function
MIVALATALLHFLWQGAALGLVAVALRPVLSRASASTRYVILLALLCAAPMLALATFTMSLGISLDITSPGSPAVVLALPSSPRWALLVTAVWAAGVAAFALRSIVDVVHIVRLRATGLPLRAWHPALDRLRACLGVRRHVALAESPAVRVPLVTGWLRPMILLPVGLATRMPASWIEAVLTHELAHIRRHDLWLGVLQRAIEILLFFHPVIWWLSSQIRCAREEACDDLVVDALQSPFEYARALTELAASDPPASSLAMGLGKGSLMSRIRRIALRKPRPLRAPRRVSTVGIALALGIAVGAGGLAKLDARDDPATFAEGADPGARQKAADENPARERLTIAWLPEEVAAFEDEIVAAATRHGVDPDLVAIMVLVESRGHPDARSPIGSRGLMQVMPQTAARIASERGIADHREEKLDDPAYNLDLGTWYLAQQIEEFGTVPPSDEDIALAAAAYNAGPTRLRQALRGEAELSEQTQRYRSRVGELWAHRHRPESPLPAD